MDFLLILVNCFQDFILLVHSMPQLDVQSFDCMVSILHSIDLVVRYFVYGTDKKNQESHSSMWDQSTSSLLLKKLFGIFPLNPVHHLSEKDDKRCFILNIMITETFLHLTELLCPAAYLHEKFLAFIEHALLGKMCSDTRSGGVVREKQILKLVPFFPKLVVQETGEWKCHLLQAFTKTFLECSPESPAKLACLTAMEEMLFSEGQGLLSPDRSDSEFLNHLITWMRELPLLLILLGDKHLSSSQIVLHHLLRCSQCALV